MRRLEDELRRKQETEVTVPLAPGVHRAPKLFVKRKERRCHKSPRHRMAKGSFFVLHRAGLCLIVGEQDAPMRQF